MANPFEFNGQLPQYDEAIGRFDSTDGNDFTWPQVPVGSAQTDPTMGEKLARKFNPFRSPEMSPQAEHAFRAPFEIGPLNWLRKGAQAGANSLQGYAYPGTRWNDYSDTPPAWAGTDPTFAPRFNDAQSIMGVAGAGSMPMSPYGALGVFGGKLKLPPRLEAEINAVLREHPDVRAAQKKGGMEWVDVWDNNVPSVLRQKGAPDWAKRAEEILAERAADRMPEITEQNAREYSPGQVSGRPVGGAGRISDEQIENIKKLWGTKSANQIAHELGLTSPGVRYQAERLGLPPSTEWAGGFRHGTRSTFLNDEKYLQELAGAKSKEDKARIYSKWKMRQNNAAKKNILIQDSQGNAYADGGPVDWGDTPVSQSPADWGDKPVDTPWRGYATVIGSGLAQGAITGVGKALQGLPELYAEKPRESAIARAGRSIEEFGKETFPLKPEEEKSITGQVATSIGTVAPVIAGGLVAPGAAIAAGAGQMGLMGAAEQAERARAKGATPEATREAALMGAGVNTALGLIPFGVIFRPIKQASPEMTAWMTAKLKAAAESGVTFAGVGEAQHWLGEEIAKEFYDPEAGYKPDAERAMVGLLSGAVLGGARRIPRTEEAPKDLTTPEPSPIEQRRAEPNSALEQLLAGEQRLAIERNQRQTDTLFPTPERREETPQTDTLFPERRAEEEKPPAVPEVSFVKPEQLTLDYQKFQTKASDFTKAPDINAPALPKPLDVYDPSKIKPVLAYEDNAGNLNVVDGFHRAEDALSRRAQAVTGQSDIQLAARIMKEAEGHSPEFMRQLGAYKNLAEGTGDAAQARILQASSQGLRERLGESPSTSRIAQDAKSLASLAPEGFGFVARGAVPPAYAAEVARLVATAQSQMRALEAVSRAKPENIEQVRRVVDDTLVSKERQQVLAKAVEALERSTTANAEERANNERLANTLQAEASKQGEISKALTDAAKQLSAGRSINAVAPSFIAKSRPIARRQLEGVQPGAPAYSLRPARINLERTGANDFAIRDGERVVGNVSVSKTNEGVRINDIYATNAELGKQKNALGPTIIREVRRQLKSEFPNAKTIEGKRVSGARMTYDEEGMPTKEGVEVKTKLSLTPKANDKRKAIESALTKLVRQQVGEHVDIKFTNKIPLKGEIEGYGGAFEDQRTAAGMYNPAEKIIRIALVDPKYSPMNAALHEPFHVVQDLLATPTELKILKREDGRLRKVAQEELGVTDEQAKAMSPLEVQATAYAAWARDKVENVPPPVRSLYNRITTFLRKAANALHGLGFRSADDVFKSAFEGEMAGREARLPGRLVEEGITGQPAFPSVKTSVPSIEQAPPTTLGPRAKKIERLIDRIGIGDVVRDIQIKLTPMAARDASIESRAAAKDFANGLQEARYTQSSLDDMITKNFTPEQQKKMWQAADEESVARQLGKDTRGIGLDRLARDERAFVERLQKRADETFDEAKKLGIYDGGDEGLPSYVTRLVLMNKGGKYERPSLREYARRLYGPRGSAIRTTTPQMIERKYLTVEETERAAKEKFGDQAEVLRNIRVLPYATGMLQEAIAGRKLIDKIKEVGKESQNETVAEGTKPTGDWFTIDHPAFYNTHEVNGVLQKTPIYVRSDFEGPLRSVLEQKNGSKIYQGLMNLKGKTMSVIMMSPMIHNQVEWGRALPAMPGKVITGRIYFEGNKAKNDASTMREAIRAGLAPIGHRGYMQDITSVPELPNLKAGRSWTSQIIAAVPGLFSKNAKESTLKAIDKLGDIWHNKLLWDRVGDLQMGLYTNLRDNLTKKGFSDLTAQRAAAHWANRYAGAIPLEAMSASARKLANMVMFSRSFTLGNIGAMKDVFAGLPRDVQAQIARDSGLKELENIKSVAKRKALSIVAMDAALFYAMGTMLQSAINTMGVGQSAATIGGALAGGIGGSLMAGPVGGIAGTLAGGYMGNQAVDSTGKRTLDEEIEKYKERFSNLLKRVNEHPFEVLNPLGWPKLVESLSATAENEPDRRDRVLVGYQKDGTAIYMRLPTGKIGEEFINYPTSPLEMMHKKLGTWARPLSEIWSNKTGLGNDKIYYPHPETTADQFRAVRDIAWHILRSQTPADLVQSGIDLATDQGDKTTNIVKTVGPFLGATFAKGAPTGMEMGEYYRMKDRHEFEVSKERDNLQRLIRGGKIDEAVQLMNDLKMDQNEMENYLKSYSGASRLNNKKMKELTRRGSPEANEAVQRYMQNRPVSPTDWGDQPVRP